MESFIYQSNPSRVVFGAGALAQVPDELARLGVSRPLLIVSERQAAEHPAVAALAARATIFADARMHTPVAVTERALEVARASGVDGLVAIGGGSSIGLSKALALRTDLPQLVVPTTYAGSEMTPILGETRDGRKATTTDARVLPEVVVYDVELTTTLPVALSMVSGMNAIAHAVEAMYARDRNPVVSGLAAQGIAALAGALPRIHTDARDREARAEALYGAWLCGTCLGSVGMALHHKLCHVIAGGFDLPHAPTHTAILPHALRYNAEAAPDAVARVAEALGTRDAAGGLFDLAASLGATMALRDLGMPRDGIARAAELALEQAYWNPRPLTLDGLRALVAAAWAGDRP